MTRVKSFISAFVALLLALAMVPSVAFAADSELKIEGAQEGHTYQVYQMLTGNVSGLENGEGTVANVDAGKNLNTDDVDAFMAAVKDLSGAELGDKVSGYIRGDAFTVLTKDAPSVTVPDGYYFVVDYFDGTVQEGDAASRFMVAVVGNTTITPKKDAPTLDKDIVDTDANEALDANGKVDTAAIGDTIEYQLTSAVPNMEGYATYKYIIRDTLSAGLTLQNDIQITIDGTALTAGQYTLEQDAQSFTLSIADLKALNLTGDIIVTYTAVVNESAQVGLDPNTNKAQLEYSNDPKNSGEGGTHVTGTTPEVITYTYVTQIAITKVGEDGATILQGAEFTLTGENLNQVKLAVSDEYVVAAGGDWYKLTDGTFTQTAPTDATASQYDSISTTYIQQPNRVLTAVGANAEAVKGYVGPDGKVTFTGLNAGKYTITESVTPEGYNTIAPIEFTITGEFKGLDSNNVPEFAWSSDNNEIALDGGVFQTTIKNTKGLVLPSTGGIGTYIFYGVGALIIVGAIAYLVVRRRRSSSEK